MQECDGACRALTYLQPKHAASEPAPFEYTMLVYRFGLVTFSLLIRCILAVLCCRLASTVFDQNLELYGEDRRASSEQVPDSMQHLSTDAKRAIEAFLQGLRARDFLVFWSPFPVYSLHYYHRHR